MRCGSVVKALTTGAEGPEFQNSAVNGYPTLFRAEEAGGSKEEKWYHTSVTRVPIQVGSSTVTFLRANMGCGRTLTTSAHVSPGTELSNVCDRPPLLSLPRVMMITLAVLQWY